MTDPIDPPPPARGERRQRARRLSDPMPKAAADRDPVTALIPVSPPPAADPKPILSAHLAGQDGQKRGLRGGPETLSKAKAAYLSAEWSGPTDRRYRPGVISKTKV